MDNNMRHKVQENPQTEIALLMVNSQYKQAWSLLAHAKDATIDLSFMRATCAFKLREHHQALSILNELKRNQVCRKVKIKALLMRSKVFRHMQLYEESQRDAMAA
jgi:uncharacterized protein YjbK